MPVTRPATVQYVLLVVVTALSLVFTVQGITAVLRETFSGARVARMPFQSGWDLHRPVQIQAEAAAAGISPEVRVDAIDGRELSSERVMLEEVRRARAGDPIRVALTLPSGQHRVATFRLASVLANGPVPSWLHVLAVNVLLLTIFPIFCMVLGCWVVVAKPRDPNAWLLLGIFYFFPTTLFSSIYWSGAVVYWSALWGDVLQAAGPVSIMFFGIYFPERVDWDIRRPWLKWVIVGPLLAMLAIHLIYTAGYLVQFDPIRMLARGMRPLNRLENLFVFLAITAFFVSISQKLRATMAPDARRRLRVLYWGASIANGPISLLVVYSLVRNKEISQDVPQGLLLAALTGFALFPLTLAYVVVVQRAMDVRILIRQGTKYFFARQTLPVVRVLLTIWMAFELSRFFSGSTHRGMAERVRILSIVGLFFAFRFVLSKRLEQRIDERFFREAYSSEQMLYELSDEARNFTEIEPLLATITERIGATLHIDRIAVFLRAGEIFELQLATGVAGPMIVGRGALALPANSMMARTLYSDREPAVIYRNDPTWIVRATPAEQTALNDLSAELLVPLPGRNRLLGVMTLGPKRSEEPYSRTDRQLLQSVASQTGLALENAELLKTLTGEIAQRERMASEIEIAREVQERLFPQSYPVVAGVDMAGCCRPAQAVGGDYYDFFLVEGAEPDTVSRLAFAVGDISGKGISASLLMASLRASLRSLARMQTAGEEPDLAGLMEHVNQLVFEASTSNRYATFFFAEFAPETRVLTYVNAGHNPPMVLRGETVLPLAATGTVIGLLEDATFEQGTLALEPGDVLLAYTDGISEAMNAAEDEWGEEEMVEAAKRLIREHGCTRSAGTLVECLLREVDAFTAGAPQHDDMTLLVCVIEGLDRLPAG